tara:strand:+ start:138 stop:467 length:330 start_codon:yes stop_codon:yes gene_type:complete
VVEAVAALVLLLYTQGVDLLVYQVVLVKMSVLYIHRVYQIQEFMVVEVEVLVMDLVVTQVELEEQVEVELVQVPVHRQEDQEQQTLVAVVVAVKILEELLELVDQELLS